MEQDNIHKLVYQFMADALAAKEAEVVCATCIGVGSPMLMGLQFDLVWHRQAFCIYTQINFWDSTFFILKYLTLS